MAQNINISAIYLGNFADIDTYERNYATENEASLLGTYGSSSDPLHKSVVTIDTDSPTQYIDTNQDTGNGTLTYDAGGGTTTVGLDSLVTFNGVVTFIDGTTAELELDAIQTMNGDVFLTAWDNSPVLGTKPIETVQLNAVSYDAWGGFAQSSYDSTTFVCYASGTKILTERGDVPVEQLKVGDLVETLDHGLQPIRWIRKSEHSLEDVDNADQPVQIKAGALGHSLPSQDLIVSPQHRILVGGNGQLQQTFATEAFAPAKSLTLVPGIRNMKGKRQITWVHFACDKHEVITANGCLSESLLLGPMVVNGLQAAERIALTDIFGPVAATDTALNGVSARECLTAENARRQIAKQLKEKRRLVAKEIRKWDIDHAMERHETVRMRETGLRVCAG